MTDALSANVPGAKDTMHAQCEGPSCSVMVSPSSDAGNMQGSTPAVRAVQPRAYGRAWSASKMQTISIAGHAGGRPGRAGAGSCSGWRTCRSSPLRALPPAHVHDLRAHLLAPARATGEALQPRNRAVRLSLYRAQGFTVCVAYACTLPQTAPTADMHCTQAAHCRPSLAIQGSAAQM